VLTGISVLEVAEGIAGPFAGMMLADLGADVLKVEPRDGDWSRTLGPPFIAGKSPGYLGVNRSKSSLPIDMCDARGQAIVHRLADKADVVIEGYRPGVAQKLGIDYQTLSDGNPRLVYCSISGYGQDGPGARRPGSDTIIQGYSGLMSVTGEADRPPSRVGTPIADTTAGVYGAMAVLIRLFDRERTGQGGYVATSLLESLLALQTVTFMDFFASAEVPARLGARSSLSAVPAEAVPTANSYVMVSCHSPRQWKRLCEAVGHPEWTDDPRMRTNNDRVTNHDAVIGCLTDALRERTTEEWLATFEEHGVNAGPVFDYGQVVRDDQVRATGMFADGRGLDGDVPQVGLPFTLPDLLPRELRQAPELGDGAWDALVGAGLLEDEIRELIDGGVIVATPPEPAS
jgi:crotonobetainyl-CoA:carnitine CoA-transferase CaiB-like acyl-CoA transferase